MDVAVYVKAGVAPTGDDRDLIPWLKTKLAVLERQRLRLRAAPVALGPGLLNSGINGAMLSEAKAEALHQYRNQVHLVSDVLQRLRTPEGVWHILWRWIRRSPAPALTVESRSRRSSIVGASLSRATQWVQATTRHR
jgi:hypothetical protein